MKVTNGAIPQDSQKAEFKKAGSFSGLGKKLKVTLATIKKYISPNIQQKKININLTSRNIKTNESSNKTIQATKKQSNKAKVEVNKKESGNDKEIEVIKKFITDIDASTNKKELKSVMLEVNKEYMFEGLPQDKYDAISKIVNEKLKSFAKK
jgi:predicted nuclease of restriction endonuclease-like (RecB) superfamily